MIDRATILGLIVAVGLLLAVMFAAAGDGVGAYWQTSSLLLVLGGSVVATMVAYPWSQFRTLGAVLRNAVRKEGSQPLDVIGTLVAMAELARRSGMLSLEAPIRELRDNFLRHGLEMAVDGADTGTIEAMLRAEMEATDLRHTCGKGLLENIGRCAPVFGMIGTLIGLVVMLGHMSDPSRIGPGMAVALLTTLYGLVLANVFCLPLARKLGQRSSDELLCKTIMLKGVLAIQAGDHPRVLEQKLRVYLPSGERNRELPRVRFESVPAVMQPAAEPEVESRKLEAAA